LRQSMLSKKWGCHPERRKKSVHLRPKEMLCSAQHDNTIFRASFSFSNLPGPHWKTTRESRAIHSKC
ncbi:MAG TPA: hypothetical protein VFF78_02865, partial [Anaerolineaceae bacterium]|nr:hypothetical protein [Anaerolineaceae bacterium]